MSNQRTGKLVFVESGELQKVYGMMIDEHKGIWFEDFEKGMWSEGSPFLRHFQLLSVNHQSDNYWLVSETEHVMVLSNFALGWPKK